MFSFEDDGSSAMSQQIDAHHAVAAGGFFFRCAGETVEPFGDCDVGEAGVRKRGDKLCFQQSAGDSSGPEIDILSRVFRELGSDHDVGDLHAPSWFQHAPDLGDGRLLIGHQVQHAV